MKFTLSREALLKPLTLVAGVVERKHTMAVLANVLLRLEEGQLSLTGSDGDIELIGKVALPEGSGSEDGAITVPARKLLDICKSLPEGSQLEFRVDSTRALLKCGRGRFNLSTLPASEFPSIDTQTGHFATLLQGDLKRLLDQTAFAMAQQDVRYYLNGMLWEISQDGNLRLVATDGHRLAMSTLQLGNVPEEKKIILPRKAVLELTRLLQEEEDEVDLAIGASHMRATMPEFSFTSKLVDGVFPDYERVVPKNADKYLLVDRLDFKAALSRTAILSNEKYHGVRLALSEVEMTITANNPEQEEAEEVVSVDYQFEPLEIGFNVSYLLDVMNVVSGARIKVSLANANSSALLKDADNPEADYVVMPMRL